MGREAHQTLAMPVTKTARAMWDEVLSFELQLRTGATRAQLQTEDVELAKLLSGVGRRRRARTGTSGSATTHAVAAVPAQAAAAAASEPGSVLNVARIGNSVAIVQVARPVDMHFIAGQHIKLGVPNGAKNPYTIASAPSDPQLEFCIERVPGGRVSTHVFSLERGMRLQLSGKPKGDFVLQPGADIHLMVATVTGIAPFRSMLREAAAQNRWSRFIVLHGASFADELVYREELEQLANTHPAQLRYLPAVSRPNDPRNQGWRGLTGRVADLAPSLARELQAREPQRSLQVYACGHPEMVQTIHTTLGAQGLPVASEVFD
jgi:ferredoxin-NADP reductase